MGSATLRLGSYTVYVKEGAEEQHAPIVLCFMNMVMMLKNVLSSYQYVTMASLWCETITWITKLK